MTLPANNISHAMGSCKHACATCLTRRNRGRERSDGVDIRGDDGNLFRFCDFFHLKCAPRGQCGQLHGTQRQVWEAREQAARQPLRALGQKEISSQQRFNHQWSEQPSPRRLDGIRDALD